MSHQRFVAAAVAAFALLFAGCGGSVCGNGVKESGEQCDDGANNGAPGDPCSSDCRSISVSRAQINVTWGFDVLGSGPEVPGYVEPHCSNFAATKAEVTIDGASPLHAVCDCGRSTVIFPPGICTDGGMGDYKPIGAGNYQVTVTLEQDDGTPITKAVSTAMAGVAPGAPVSFDVRFKKDDLLKQDYVGTLDFHASWGSNGVECDEAKPPVGMESVLLIPDGETKPAMGMTVAKNGFGGTPLDGTPGKCFVSDHGANTYEEITNLRWGRYNLAVFSRSAPYCVSQPVFVNPGTLNATYELVVPLGAPGGGAADGGSSGSTGDGGAMTCP
jgi:cysteine-rich repeat protein